MTSLPALWLIFCKVAHVQNHDVAWPHLVPAIALPILFCTLYTVLWRVPEQGQRKAFLLLSLGSNLVVLAGLWHGANWTFILWGAYHGALLIIFRLVPPLHALESAKSAPRVFLGTVLMFALTLIGWAIFRCGSLAQLGNWFAEFGHWQATSGIGWSKPAIGESLATPVVNVAVDWLKPALWFAIHALPLALLQFAARHSGDESDNDKWPWPARGVVYLLMFLAITSSTGGEVEFIYFQF